MNYVLIVHPANGGTDKSWDIEQIESISTDGVRVFRTKQGNCISVSRSTDWIVVEEPDASVNRR